MANLPNSLNDISTNELLALDAVGQSELVKQGEVHPLELVEASIKQIERLNPHLNAVITPLFDKARIQAQSAHSLTVLPV